MAHKIGVAGAGFQGRGIAQRFALAGRRVVLYDVDPAQLESAPRGLKSARARALLECTLRREDLASCALVIENVPEEVDLKRRVLAELEAAAPGAVLGSNSSSFRPEELSVGLARPEKLLGVHFLGAGSGNPVLELVRSPLTGDDSVKTARELLVDAGFEPIEVGSCRAFVFNRLSCAGLGNLARTVDLGLLDEQTFCRYALTLRPRPVHAHALDQIGLDVIVAVLRSCRESYGPRFGVARWLEELAAAGRLGVKTGRGILDHTAGPVTTSDGPLPPAARPRTDVVNVGVRGPSALAFGFLSAVLTRPDRRLIFLAGEGQAFLDELRRTNPAGLSELDGRCSFTTRFSAGDHDLLIDCAASETPSEKVAALSETVAPGSASPPLLVCSPIHSLEQLSRLSPAGPALGLMSAYAGFGLNTELVTPPGAGPSARAFKDFILEATGRVIEVPDGPARPFSFYAIPRILEARRIVQERIAGRDQIVRILGGEDPVGDAGRWGRAVLSRVSEVLEQQLGAALLEPIDGFDLVHQGRGGCDGG